ncbi:hypothetical protein [Microbispora sp. NPDC049125]|uniref:hypothetical protein n=1 Tax=Microbispora sp. NPDC049125 TaxID=3154929 RepID=UPI003466B1CD
MATQVTLKLAHPLLADQAAAVRAKDTTKDYAVGDEITVPLAEARAVINAGYAMGVDPENKQQVEAVLNAKPTAKKSSGGGS